MLDADSGSRPFEEGRLVGQEEERTRLRQIFHDALSPELLVALFTAHSAKEHLKDKAAPEAAELAKITSLLNEVIEKRYYSPKREGTAQSESPLSSEPRPRLKLLGEESRY